MCWKTCFALLLRKSCFSDWDVAPSVSYFFCYPCTPGGWFWKENFHLPHCMTVKSKYFINNKAKSVLKSPKNIFKKLKKIPFWSFSLTKLFPCAVIKVGLRLGYLFSVVLPTASYWPLFNWVYIIIGTYRPISLLCASTCQ